MITGDHGLVNVPSTGKLLANDYPLLTDNLIRPPCGDSRASFLRVKNNKKTEVKNTTLDPISLNYHLKKIKKLNINNIILEASSHGLKQNRLDGLKFDVGIFSNLSHDHLDYHKSYKDYLNSKLYLFEKLLKKKSTIITDFNIPEYKRIKNISLKKKTKLITILNKNSDLSVISHQYLEEKQLLKIKYKKNFYSFRLNLIGKTQVKNVLMAIIAATKSNIKINIQKARFCNLNTFKFLKI